MIKEHSIKVERTARVVTNGTINDQTRYIWFVCHGYGQLANYFIQKFNLTDEHFIVAPEALSRFYLGQDYGKVGASWMTKVDRENEILDYLEYLEKVYVQFVSPHKNEKIKIVALGFSQGCATITRWAATTSQPIDWLVLGGGIPAQELLDKELLKKYNAIFSIGEKDEFFKDQNIDNLSEKIKPLFKQLITIKHAEGHIMDESVIKTLLNQL
jgi:predicted esterase